jgi:HEPN domain-containing protein
LTSDQGARAFLDDAALILEEARTSLASGRHHRAVRKAQESAELAVKAVFRFAGLEHPKSHVLGRLVRKDLRKLGILADEAIQTLADYSDSLSLDREPAFYGTHDGIPASELFDEEDAKDALRKAEWILQTARGVIPGA